MNRDNRRIIFFDIDGTLVTEGPGHYVPQSANIALDKLRENGHVCIINTGRPFSALDDVIKNINVDGYSCGCGTNIRIGKEILLSHKLDSKLCAQIARDIEECDFEWLLEGEHQMYYSTREYKSFFWRDIKALTEQLPDNIHAITPDEFDQIDFVKFVIILKEHSNYERFYSLYKDDFTFIDRGNKMFEIIPNMYSKATGMKFLEEYFNIPHENSVAVGDSTNDIPMLDYASYSIVMGGSSEVLNDHADFITSPILEDGIYKAFKHMGLI